MLSMFSGLYFRIKYTLSLPLMPDGEEHFDKDDAAEALHAFFCLLGLS